MYPFSKSLCNLVFIFTNKCIHFLQTKIADTEKKHKLYYAMRNEIWNPLTNRLNELNYLMHILVWFINGLPKDFLSEHVLSRKHPKSTGHYLQRT